MAAMTGKKPVFPSGPSLSTSATTATTAIYSATATTVAAPQPLATPSATEELARRVAEAKKRVADAQKLMSVKDNPYLVSTALFFR